MKGKRRQYKTAEHGKNACTHTFQPILGLVIFCFWNNNTICYFLWPMHQHQNIMSQHFSCLHTYSNIKESTIDTADCWWRSLYILFSVLNSEKGGSNKTDNLLNKCIWAILQNWCKLLSHNPKKKKNLKAFNRCLSFYHLLKPTIILKYQ